MMGPLRSLASLEGVERGVINYGKVKFTGLSPELWGPRIGLSAVKTELQCGLTEMDAVSAVSPESAETRKRATPAG
jgi:hypothetical protein